MNLYVTVREIRACGVSRISITLVQCEMFSVSIRDFTRDPLEVPVRYLIRKLDGYASRDAFGFPAVRSGERTEGEK